MRKCSCCDCGAPVWILCRGVVGIRKLGDPFGSGAKGGGQVIDLSIQGHQLVVECETLAAFMITSRRNTFSTGLRASFARVIKVRLLTTDLGASASVAGSRPPEIIHVVAATDGDQLFCSLSRHHRAAGPVVRRTRSHTTWHAGSLTTGRPIASRLATLHMRATPLQQ